MTDIIEEFRRQRKWYEGEKAAVAQWQMYEEERRRDLEKRRSEEDGTQRAR